MNANASHVHHGIASWRDTIENLFETVSRHAAGWYRAYRRRRATAEAAARLRGLGERELRDIGLHRGVINGSVRGL